MKKRIILGIIICILLSSCLIVNAASNGASLQVEKNEKTITVTLKLPAIKDGLDALAGKIEYDKSKLEFVEVKKVNEKWQEPSYNNNSGKFTLLINSETVKEANDAIRFTFKIKANVTGNTKITISELTGATSKDEKVVLDSVNAVIEISNGSTDGGNSGNGDNNNIIDGGNTENGDNNILDGGNSGNNNNITNEENKNNVYNNNITNGKNNSVDNIAQGKFPHAGKSLTGYIVVIVAILAIFSIVLVFKQKIIR